MDIMDDINSRQEMLLDLNLRERQTLVSNPKDNGIKEMKGSHDAEMTSAQLENEIDSIVEYMTFHLLRYWYAVHNPSICTEEHIEEEKEKALYYQKYLNDYRSLLGRSANVTWESMLTYAEGLYPYP